jgi:hypothetical protein
MKRRKNPVLPSIRSRGSAAHPPFHPRTRVCRPPAARTTRTSIPSVHSNSIPRTSIPSNPRQRRRIFFVSIPRTSIPSNSLDSIECFSVAGASRSGGAAGACELRRRLILKRWPPSLPPSSAQPWQWAARPDASIHIVLLCRPALSSRVRHGIEASPAWDLTFAQLEYFEGTAPHHFLPLSTLYILEFRWETCLPNQLEQELHVAELHDLIELRLCIYKTWYGRHPIVALKEQ